MRLLLTLLTLLVVVPAAHAGAPVRIAETGRAPVAQLFSDDQQRVYAASETGDVTVYTPSGRELARWTVPARSIAVTPAGDVFAHTGTTVTRYTWDGRAVAAWPLPEASAGPIVVDPRGSLIVSSYTSLGLRYARYAFDGTPLGPVPVGLAHLVTANGELWSWGGVLRAYRGDGRLLAEIGVDCSSAADCTAPGPYGNPSSARLIPGPGGTLSTLEGRRIQVFDQGGRLRYACDDPLGTKWIRAMTAVGNRLVLAAEDGIYRTSTRPGKCLDSPIRIHSVALVHGPKRDVVRVRVTGRFPLGFSLRSERDGGRFTGRRVKLGSGRHDLAIPGCKRVRTCLGEPPYLLAASGVRGAFYVSTRLVSAR